MTMEETQQLGETTPLETIENVQEVKEKVAGPYDPTEEEKAAATFSYLMPIIRRMTSGMSSKSIRRVMIALAEYPLQVGDKPRLIGKEEQQLFEAMFQVAHNKQIILNFAKKQFDSTKPTEEAPQTEKETNEQGN